MSLKDTIRGAREEVAANVKPFERKKDAVEAAEAEKSTASQGFTRRSAASGKPAREAAAGVRMVTADGKTKSKSKLTKEERKAERKREREIEDQRYTLSQAVLKENEEYNRKHKIWLRFLIAGIVLMVLALSLYGLVVQQGQNAPEALAISSIVVMVLAYIVVIAGMVYDWRKVRPLRNDAEKRVSSMSDKRVRSALSKRAAESSK